MGDVVNMRDYKTKLERDPGLIRTREDAVDHLATELAKMLDEGDTLLVLECQNGETLNVHKDDPVAHRSYYLTRPRDELDDILSRAVEMPADCPA